MAIVPLVKGDIVVRFHPGCSAKRGLQSGGGVEKEKEKIMKIPLLRGRKPTDGRTQSPVCVSASAKDNDANPHQEH